jgi:hypothetical protein
MAVHPRLPALTRLPAGNGILPLSMPFLFFLFFSLFFFFLFTSSNNSLHPSITFHLLIFSSIHPSTISSNTTLASATMHAQLVAATLALAGSVLGGAVPGSSSTSASWSSTTTVTMFSPDATKPAHATPPAASCSVCPHPKDWDRNWDSDAVLNDTRKHHKSFKLFAHPGDYDELRFPLHLISRKSSKDMWNLKFGSIEDPSLNPHQPRWNLHDGSLQTDGSAPINDTVHFRLFDGMYSKDTEYWTGTVYHDVSTTHQSKRKYHKEGNAKLIAKSGWSLVREHDDPASYILKGTKPAGGFFVCIDQEAADKVPSTTAPDFLDQYKTWLANSANIVYTASELKDGFRLSTNIHHLITQKGCSPLTIRVRWHQDISFVGLPQLTFLQAEGWTNPK